MAETNPQPDPGTVPGSMAPTKSGAGVKTHADQAAKDRDADLKRLAELQGEYLKLRDQTEHAPQVTPAQDPRAAALARKGDVTREMDAIKRKHNLA